MHPHPLMATGVAGAPAALLLLAVLLLLSPLPGRGAGNGTEPRELGRLDERAAAPTPPPVGGITGQLESFNVTTVGDATGATRARLRGWVSDVERDFPDISSPISVLVDGVAVVNTTANVSRPDLVPDKAPEAQHGIDVELPATLAAKLWQGRHVISVAVHREAEVDWPLAGGPLCINSKRLTCATPHECACNRSGSAL